MNPGDGSLRDLELVVTLGETRSLVGASRRLRVTAPSLSRQLARLEERLGVRLVQRTTRSLSFTAAGLRYREHAARILDALAVAERDVREAEEVPRGTLRVSAPTVLGEHLVAPAVGAFREQWPGMRVELELDDRMVDLVKGNFDVAVRVSSKLTASALVARRLGTQALLLCASPAYLAGAPPLRTPEDLRQHACVELAHGSDRGRWRFTRGGKARTVTIEPQVITNGLGALRRCVIAGTGVGQVPNYLVLDDLREGRLVQLLPGWSLPERGVYALHAGGSLLPPRVRRFVDVLARIVAARLGPARG
ncbi:LysR family transcriptional regulator [Polyangium sp. y55x31]|uniref:LysR family transcriptional regulator n=1 Tax=Polyangium sp. y55x31 TaxID=3042688 RepID=UPI002482F0FC|nr:LysR family transcriptional regulator [Polyangium sp. y55x31]MDI1483710.1 LysR family transcriptional regulator [Polyangium sp. y55x31]